MLLDKLILWPVKKKHSKLQLPFLKSLIFFTFAPSQF